MHVCKGSWSGQAFALATDKDSGGKKSRIRRSKEERKSMVESFIKKYQKTNDGHFPSLNLTHKEVGGSFYTVREIVREIIQENRVLAPPKVSLEDDHSDFLEHHPLGSISMEPEIDLSESERVHMVAHTAHNKYQISSEENISSYSGSYPLDLDNGQIVNGVGKVAEKGASADTTCESHHAPDHYQATSMDEVSDSTKESPLMKGHELEGEKIVNGSEVLDIPYSNTSPLTNIDRQENIDDALLSGEKINGWGNQSLSDEHDHHKENQTVDKTEEFGQKVHTEPTVMEPLDTEKFGAQHIETSQAMKSPSNSDVVVETFPLRPVTRTVNNMGEESDKLFEAARTLLDQAVQHDEKKFTLSTSGFATKNSEEKLSDSNVKMNGLNSDEKVVLNLRGPSLENAKQAYASESSVLVKELESKVSLPGSTKASSSTEILISEDSVEVGGKSSDQDNSSSSKGNNGTLDRINLDTWEGASKKSTRPESNPFLALVKAFISSFVKFLTE